ncbi:hypothetical protein GCM10022206_92540 [Streptomyces chiangmaiensis]
MVPAAAGCPADPGDSMAYRDHATHAGTRKAGAPCAEWREGLLGYCCPFRIEAIGLDEPKAWNRRPKLRDG